MLELDAAPAPAPAAANDDAPATEQHHPPEAHAAALIVWAAELERRPDGGVLARTLIAAYGEMCVWQGWHMHEWATVVAALKSDGRVTRRYAWVRIPGSSSASRLLVYDLPGGAADAAAPGTHRAAKAVAQPRGRQGRFVKPAKQRRAA